MSEPTFSVITPTYNSTATISWTIDSVRTQTRADFELVIVDDGSSDDTPELIELIASKDDRVRLIRQENQGTSGARNTGIAAARGRLICFLDHDDLWLPSYLEQVADALAGAPDAGFAYTNAWTLDDRFGKIRRLTTWEEQPDVPRTGQADEQLVRLVRSNYIMSSATIPAEVLREVGDMDTAIQGTDDWDLWLRILATGRRAVPTPDTLLISRHHPSKQSADLVMMLRNDERVIEKVDQRDDISEEVHAAARAKLADIRRRLTRRQAGGPVGALRAIREAQFNLVDRFGGSRVWLDEAPPEVAAAFPELAAGYGRSRSLLRVPE